MRLVLLLSLLGACFGGAQHPGGSGGNVQGGGSGSVPGGGPRKYGDGGQLTNAGLYKVSHDGTLSGDGRPSNPLAVVGGGGGGTVTNVATGTGLTGGPITTTGTIAIANTAVTPGAYTLAGVTVNQQGQLTAASSYAGTTAPADKAITALSAAGAGTFAYFYDTPGTGLATGATANIVKIADTAVTPASYTYSSITVNQQGQITAASNGATPALAATTISAGTMLSGGGDLSANRTINLADIATSTVIGRVAGGTGAPSALTTTQLTTLVNTFTTSLSGAVPASGGGTTTYLRADGTFAVPPGTGVTSVATGTGLTGGTITSTGTLSLNINAGTTQTCGAGTAVTALTGVGLTTCTAFGSSSLTNGAGNNIITKSNGTNLVASAESDDGVNFSSTEQHIFGHAGAVSYTSLTNTGVLNYDSTGHNLVLASQYTSGTPHVLIAASNSGNAATVVDVSTGSVAVTGSASASTSLAAGMSSPAATILEARGSYDNTVINTAQLRVDESGTYRLSIGFDEAGGTTGVIDNSFADPSSEIDLRWANVNKAQFFGNGNLTLQGGLTGTSGHFSADGSFQSDVLINGKLTMHNHVGINNTGVIDVLMVNSSTAQQQTFAVMGSGTGSVNTTSLAWATVRGTAGYASSVSQTGASVSLTAVGIDGEVFANSGANWQIGVYGLAADTTATTGNIGICADVVSTACNTHSGLHALVADGNSILNGILEVQEAGVDKLYVASTGTTTMLGQGLGVGGLYQGQAQDIADVMNSGLIRTNYATYADEGGNVGDLSQAQTTTGSNNGWGFNNATSTIAYTTTNALNAPWYPSTLTQAGSATFAGKITCTNGAGNCTSAGTSDWRSIMTSVSTGVADLRSTTSTFSVWLQMVSGTNTGATISIARYNDNEKTGATCPTITATGWTRCSVTKTWSATSYTDNSELRVYIEPRSTTGMYIDGMQPQAGAVPTPYETNGVVGTGPEAYRGSTSPGIGIPNFSTSSPPSGAISQGGWSASLGVGGTKQVPLGGIASDGTVFGHGFYTAANIYAGGFVSSTGSLVSGDEIYFTRAGAISYSGATNTGLLNYDTTGHTLTLAAQYTGGTSEIDLATSSSGNAATAVAITSALVTITPPITASSSKNKGTITLSSGTGTATVTSGAQCACSDTTATNVVKCAVSTTTLTATGIGSDVISYVCM